MAVFGMSAELTENLVKHLDEVDPVEDDTARELRGELLNVGYRISVHDGGERVERTV